MQKTKITHDTTFSEIFRFAGEHYDISWNDANTIFFTCVLTYRGMNKIDIHENLYDGNEYLFNEGKRLFKEKYPDHDPDCWEDTTGAGKDNLDQAWDLAYEIQVNDIPKETINALDDYFDKPKMIILHFMQHHNVKGILLVDNT